MSDRQHRWLTHRSGPHRARPCDELACLRLGYPTDYAKGAHLLPAELTIPWRLRWSERWTAPSCVVP